MFGIAAVVIGGAGQAWGFSYGGVMLIVGVVVDAATLSGLWYWSGRKSPDQLQQYLKLKLGADSGSSLD